MERQSPSLSPPSCTVTHRHGTFKEKIGSVSMEAKNLDTACSIDVISNLPDDLLSKILSSLPIKEAASTSVLSKNWRNLYRWMDTLDFDESDFMNPNWTEKKSVSVFKKFVETTLALRRGSHIKKFSVRCNCDDKHIELAYVHRWICNAVKRGVIEMDISIKSRSEVYLPRKLFSSKTLVKLSLGTKLSLGKIPPDASLPALKSLSIDSIIFEGNDLCDVFLASCPVLEELLVQELLVRHGDPNCICSRSMKKLSVHNDIDLSKTMSFDAPNLVSLDYSDYAAYKYPQVNLASLVKASLDLHYSQFVKKPDISGLIIGISNVKTLHLSPDSVDVISGCVKDGLVIPMFNNLVSLSFGSKNRRGWRLLSHMLKQSPKLETLIIQDLNSYRGDVSLCPYQVKVLHILNYEGTAKELKHLKGFIGEAECLNLVLVEIAEAIVVDHSIIQETYSDLMTLLGDSASPNCEVEVEYYN